MYKEVDGTTDPLTC